MHVMCPRNPDEAAVLVVWGRKFLELEWSVLKAGLQYQSGERVARVATAEPTAITTSAWSC